MALSILLAQHGLLSDSINVWDLSNQAFNYACSHIKISSTRLSEKELATPYGMEVVEKFTRMREEPVPEEYSLAWIQEISKQAAKYQIGNCCEYACMVFDFMHTESIKRRLDFNIELYNNPFSDHFFIVVGRDTQTSDTDPRLWNEDTIICDPWIEKRCYKLSEVDFSSLHLNKREVIGYWLPETGSSGAIILEKEVLSSSNGDNTSLTLMQPQMVLRARFHKRKYQLFNQKVPMVYGPWDFPQESSEEDCELIEGSGFFI